MDSGDGGPTRNEKVLISFLILAGRTSDIFFNASCAGISDNFIALGIDNLYHAINYTLEFPYGRASDRANFNLVLKEHRGACSTEHALIFQLAKLWYEDALF